MILALTQEAGDRQGEAQSLSNLAEIVRECGCLKIAESYVEETFIILHSNAIIGDVLNTFHTLIGICDQRGAETKAIDWCEQAIEFAAQTENEMECEEFKKRQAGLVVTEG